MKLLHIVNASAWLMNTIVWAGYAHSLPMAAASAAAMFGAIFMAWRES